MRHYRVWAAALLGAAALLVAPTAASAQVMIGRVGIVGNPYYGYYPGTSWYYPSYYSYGYYPSGWGYSPGYAYYNYPSYWYGNAWSFPTNLTVDRYTTPSYSYGQLDTSGYYTTGGPAADAVKLNVLVPDPNAQVWVEGQLTSQSGRTRDYISPPVDPAKNYVYQVRSRWIDNGRTMDETKRIPVHAGETATVDFTVPTNHSRVDEIRP